jgi:hypothetical protein
MTRWLSSNRTFIFRLLGTLLAIGLITLLIWEEGWDEILHVLGEISPWYFFLAFVSLLFSRLFVILRWYVLLRSGGVRITFNQAAQLTLMGLFASNFLPTTIGGDVVRLAGAMQLGYDRAVCLASIAADRIIGIVGMAFTLPLGIVPLWNSSSVSQIPSMAFVIPPFINRLLGFARRTFESLSAWLRQPKALFISLLCTWGNMAFIFASLYILTQSLGFKVPYWLLAGIWCLSYFVTLIPISINGYGVQELSLTILLTRLAGLETPASLTIAVLIRLVFIFASLPGAVFLPTILESIARGRNIQE